MAESIEGRIVKGIAGFYYVNAGGSLYECHARGLFRKDKIKPMVGDYVTIEITDDVKMTGNIIAIKDRKNSLIRPLVSNVDQAIIVFAFTKPEPNLILLDKFLITMLQHEVDTVVIFNKEDLSKENDLEYYKENYKNAGVRFMVISALNNKGVDEVRDMLKGKTTVLAGPSGVGKSTLINNICKDVVMETGDISEKLSRGKHTTRHSEIFSLGDNTYIMDTPGFTAFDIEEGMDKSDLKHYYPEFYSSEGACKFDPCSHTHEPSCKIKEQVMAGSISKLRYDNYVYIYDELKNRRVYR